MEKGPLDCWLQSLNFVLDLQNVFLSTNLLLLHNFLTIAFQQKEMSSLLQYLLCHSSKCWQQKVFGTCIHILMRYSLSKITSKGIDFQIWKKKTEKRLNFLKKKKNFRSNCQHPLDHGKSKRVPEKHLFLLYQLCLSLWLCGSQKTVENSSRDGTTRPPDLPLEKPVCRSGSNS